MLVVLALRLQKRREMLFEKLVEMIANHDFARARVYAEEIAFIDRMLASLKERK
jgi:division protein CdvB (Snf7/Vps24/ESCRT-III family)